MSLLRPVESDDVVLHLVVSCSFHNSWDPHFAALLGGAPHVMLPPILATPIAICKLRMESQVAHSALPEAMRMKWANACKSESDPCSIMRELDSS